MFINGPNLNLLGTREPDVYGDMSLEHIENEVRRAASQLDVGMEWFQSNHEGDIVEKIHSCWEDWDGIVLNPAAFSHTSVAVLDALRAVKKPCVEVHLSNIHAREEFRRASLTASACRAVISGMGWLGYLYALKFLYAICGVKSEKEKQ
ncbi:MAG: type II 3-dehydroquinate dehydratase [Candidatus Aminicenantes bacterium]|nr:type II 3-dehydroquinate dehydratase [Candidatus Aminicenantes bacterium]